MIMRSQYIAWMIILCVTAFGALSALPATAQDHDAAPGGQPAFFSALNDVPLMPGLFEMTGETVFFDKPEGRIAESSAFSQGPTPDDIRHFYRQTLPQLGWQRTDGDSYVRDDETLTMDIRRDPQGNIIRIMIAPHSH